MEEQSQLAYNLPTFVPRENGTISETSTQPEYTRPTKHCSVCNCTIEEMNTRIWGQYYGMETCRCDDKTACSHHLVCRRHSEQFATAIKKGYDISQQKPPHRFCHLHGKCKGCKYETIQKCIEAGMVPSAALRFQEKDPNAPEEYLFTTKPPQEPIIPYEPVGTIIHTVQIVQSVQVVHAPPHIGEYTRMIELLQKHLSSCLIRSKRHYPRKYYEQFDFIHWDGEIFKDFQKWMHLTKNTALFSLATEIKRHYQHLWCTQQNGQGTGPRIRSSSEISAAYTLLGLYNGSS
jgi:hypothetical protein